MRSSFLFFLVTSLPVSADSHLPEGSPEIRERAQRIFLEGRRIEGAEEAARSGDYETALAEFRALSKAGNVIAQANLGMMYRLGHGVPQDYLAAHMWLNIAAANRHERAASERDALSILLTPDLVVEAQRRARVCMASDYRDCD